MHYYKVVEWYSIEDGQVLALIRLYFDILRGNAQSVPCHAI